MSHRIRKPRILFLNRSYWPDTEATGQLLTALCEGLADRFDVHVLTGQPNVSSTDEEWQGLDERNGVTIHRVEHSTYSKRNMLLKGLNFLSFANACRRQIKTLPSPDIVIFETDPFLLPFVANQLQKHCECNIVGYLQDIYPDVAVALNKVSNNWFIRTLRKRLFAIYQDCDRMVVLSDDMKNLLVEGNVPEQNIRIVPNWADINAIRPIAHTDNSFRKAQGLSGKFVAMYSGNLGLTQRLEEFVDAAALLQDDPEIQFVFVGQGARRPDLERQVETLGLTNVLFCDYQPLDQLSHSLGAADLHLIPLTAELTRCLMPSKLYGIIAAGRPYLTNAPAGCELHRITQEEKVGVPVRAGSAQEIADRIRSVKQDSGALSAMGQRARHLAERSYTKAQAIATFEQVLTEVSCPSQPAYPGSSGIDQTPKSAIPSGIYPDRAA